MSPETRIDYHSLPAGPLLGAVHVPGDKSISHRAIILAAIAQGITLIDGMLKSADTIATINAFREMGVRIDEQDNQIAVHGVGKYGLSAPDNPLDFGNSGTSVRLMSGLLAGQQFDSTLMGDASLSRRPMKRIVEPLRQMGADISYSGQGTLPMQIRGSNKLHGISYDMPVASAQLKSCLLLAGLYAEGTTTICEPAITRDHTERMLAMFGAHISVADHCIEVRKGELQAVSITIPGDISSAAFFLVAGSICPGSDLILNNIGVNPTRSAVIEILMRMGADITISANTHAGSEPTADIRVRYSPLTGIVIPPELVPIAIDEFPAIMVAAAFAEGNTVLNDAAELRVKESDRIEAMADGLQRLGVNVVTRPDGMTVTGGPVGGGEIMSYGDHRIAMAFAVAAGHAQGTIKVLDCENVNTSFPGFVDTASALGLKIISQNQDG